MLFSETNKTDMPVLSQTPVSFHPLPLGSERKDAILSPSVDCQSLPVFLSLTGLQQASSSQLCCSCVKLPSPHLLHVNGANCLPSWDPVLLEKRGLKVPHQRRMYAEYTWKFTERSPGVFNFTLTFHREILPGLMAY